MGTKQAVEIVKSLADGIDPFTGEKYAAGSPYQHPDTVRALFLAVKGLEALEQYERRKADLPANAGKPWSAEEEKNLVRAFDEGTPVSRLASDISALGAPLRPGLFGWVSWKRRIANTIRCSDKRPEGTVGNRFSLMMVNIGEPRRILESPVEMALGRE